MSNMKRALVLGVNGQDGSFLAENLLNRGYEVLGLDLHHELTRNLEDQRFRYEQLDLREVSGLTQALNRYQPTDIFHFAAVHGSAGTIYEQVWQDMLAVNVGSVQVILEYLRTRGAQARLVYASSGKVFGPDYPRRISERSVMKSSCLYTITKNASRELIAYYRRHHKVKSSILFLFNHESERRPSDFFIPKIVNALAEALGDQRSRTEIWTLDFPCDWGSAEEYMDIAIDIAEKAAGEDFVLATGKTLNARVFVQELFKRYCLDSIHHLIETAGTAAAENDQPYRVLTQKLKKIIGRSPSQDILTVCENILLRNHGVRKPGRSKGRS
jgi:GDPmannose 4,6-dehydratase